MSNNPYAHPQTPEFLPDEATLPQRVSTLAILSLVFAITCVLAPIGLILGGAALISISRSRGQLRGTGLAVTGIVIGLVCSLLLVGTGIGANYAVNMAVTPADKALQAIEAGNWTAARAEMAGPAASVTDDELLQFRDAYQGDYGSYQSLPRGVFRVLADANDPRMQAMSQVMRLYPGNRSLPLLGTFDQGTAPVIVVMETMGGPPVPANIGIVRPDGSLLWLVDPSAGP